MQVTTHYQWRNPSKTPPGGYQYRQAETNWAPNDPMLPRDMIVDQILRHRLNNPQIHRSVERRDVEQDLCDYNATRLRFDQDWFIVGEFIGSAVIALAQTPTVKPQRKCATCGGRR